MVQGSLPRWHVPLDEIGRTIRLRLEQEVHGISFVRNKRAKGERRILHAVRDSDQVPMPVLLVCFTWNGLSGRIVFDLGRLGVPSVDDTLSAPQREYLLALVDDMVLKLRGAAGRRKDMIDAIDAASSFGPNANNSDPERDGTPGPEFFPMRMNDAFGAS